MIHVNQSQNIRLDGNVLFLTEDPMLIREQLAGSVGTDGLLGAPLLDNVSTDEIIPGWCCYWYDQKLGDYAYLGLRGAVFAEGDLKRLAPMVIVSGRSKGCGSSREHAVYAEKYAGVKIVFAESFEKIYQQNCRNVGIITCTDFSLLRRLLAGDELPLGAFTRECNDIERAIVESGGLFRFNLTRQRQSQFPKAHFESLRPLNVVEKIIQTNLAPMHGRPNGATVKVGESYFAQVSVRFSHEYVTPMAADMFQHQFGVDALLSDPDSCYFFQDHLTLSQPVLEKRGNGQQLISRVCDLNSRQENFARSSGGHFIGPSEKGGSRAICHNYIVENVARAGNLIIGTDSHTCTAGALGALAFGVGATDIANAWYTREVLVKVPEVIRINLRGHFVQRVSAKDLMLALLAMPVVSEGETLGRVLVFSGEGCAQLDIDERATLCNMAVEAGAITALFEPDETTASFLERHREGGSGDMLISDDEAIFAFDMDLDMREIGPMVSLPGDPRNAVPLASLSESVAVNRVYGGSCTGGKARDMDMYAQVFSVGREKGLRVPDGISAYIQMGSEMVMKYAEEKGYLQLFADVGVTVLPPSCGACINAGPGVSESADDVTVSAQNRNFPGRSGPGRVYLASPYTVAATALAGRLVSVEEALEVKEMEA